MKTQRLCIVGRVLAVCAVMFFAHVAGAQYGSDFEALNGSAGGTVLTGQDMYYIPGGTNSIDFNVYTYSGNALGLPVNPHDREVEAVSFGEASHDALEERTYLFLVEKRRAAASLPARLRNLDGRSKGGEWLFAPRIEINLDLAAIGEPSPVSAQVLSKLAAPRFEVCLVGVVEG